MESIKDRIVKLRNLLRLTQQDLSEKIHISDKVISKWECGESEPSLADTKSLAEFFKVSMDYLASGIVSPSDKLVLERKPTTGELADDFLKQCWEIIKIKNLQKYKDILLPKKVIGRARPEYGEHVTNLSGGVFKGDHYWEWQNVITPYIDRKKLIALDNFDIYEKLKDLPTSYGEVRFLAKKYNRQDILTLMPENHSSDFYYDRDIQPLSAKDIKGCTDIGFYKELSKAGQNELNSALNELCEDNENFWLIVKCLIENGAVKLIPLYDAYYETTQYVPDVLGTKLLLEMAREKTKNK